MYLLAKHVLFLLSLALVISTCRSVEVCSNPQECSTSLGDESSGRILLQTKHSGSKASSAIEASINPSGAAAPLSQEGYAAVADRCCQGEMRQFIERAVFDQGLEVCAEGGLYGLAPYHSCEKGPQTFADLTASLLEDTENRCKWLAPTGTCTEPPPDCPAFPGTTASDCSCSASKATKLNFTTATLSQNNLGGSGPDSGAQEMRYSNISPGLDLVLTALSSYNPVGGNEGIPDLMRNGFGGLVVRWGTSTDIKFQFVDAGTSTPQVLPEVHMAFFDLDKPNSGPEFLAGKGYKGYITDLDTTLAASTQADGRTRFSGTTSVPNPTSPGVASDAQRKSSVMFFFENVSEFEVTFGHDSTQTFTQAGQQALFFISGSSVLLDRCDV